MYVESRRIDKGRYRRRLNTNKMLAHDDVTHGAMARLILKKIHHLATRIKLTLSILNAMTLKLIEKFDHPFSHLFMFSNISAQGHGFNAVTVII